MGLAAFLAVAVIGTVLAGAVLYGTGVGLVRLGRFLWRLLVVS